MRGGGGGGGGEGVCVFVGGKGIRSSEMADNRSIGMSI